MLTERSMRTLAVAAVLTPFVLGLTAAGADRGGREVFRFTDPEIVESSGLVVEGGLAYTTNDSGDTGRVFTVDTATGATVGVSFWADGPTDVEALAPAGRGHVWVADIGDNTASRESIQVTRVPVGVGDRTVSEETMDLVYPDGARDAEALLVHPVTGRLYVVTKGVFAGELYAAPPELADRAPNTLGLIGATTGIVTDGAFFPDGEHLILRTYTSAIVYSFPALEEVGSFELPPQDQGEGIAAPSTRFVYLSSEGQQAPVLRVPVPAKIRAAVEPRPESTIEPTIEPTTEPATSSSGSTGGATSVDTITPDAIGQSPWPWIVSSLIFAGLLVVLVRALRPR